MQDGRLIWHNYLLMWPVIVTPYVFPCRNFYAENFVTLFYETRLVQRGVNWLITEAVYFIYFLVYLIIRKVKRKTECPGRTCWWSHVVLLSTAWSWFHTRFQGTSWSCTWPVFHKSLRKCESMKLKHKMITNNLKTTTIKWWFCTDILRFLATPHFTGITLYNKNK